MSTPAPPEPVVLVCAVLRRQSCPWDEIAASLEQRFGLLTALSDERPFIETTYYEREMGPDLLRRYVAFDDLVDPGALPDCKIAANAIESASTANNARAVNLDPGIVTGHSLILASGKDFSHRIYLRDSIYAEVTLVARKHTLDVLPWTYPDYQRPDVIEFFEQQRQRLLAIRRAKTGLLD
jgi:hypothetical protein